MQNTPNRIQTVINNNHQPRWVVYDQKGNPVHFSHHLDAREALSRGYFVEPPECETCKKPKRKKIGG